MSKTLIGIVSFGNLNFTRLTIEEIKKTTTKSIDFFIVVGKPGDWETIDYLVAQGIPHIVHNENYGFPYSLNDIYQKAFEHSEYNNLIIAGNDIVPYPGTIDAMIELADNSEYGWVSACQFDVKGLVKTYPETAKYFDIENNYAFVDFDARPWEVFKAYDKPKIAIRSGLSDIHNLALYKKAVYDTIGYVDVNFYPAYFSDNDYARRGVNANLAPTSCTLANAYYFHFWSRTIHQGVGGSTHGQFRNNSTYYVTKWGGGFGKEKYIVPFNGIPYKLCEGVVLEPNLKIASREDEKKIIGYWRNK